MKKNISLKKILIVFLISICVWLVGGIKTYAATHGSDWDKVINKVTAYDNALSNIALQSYDTAKNISISDSRYLQISTDIQDSLGNTMISENFMPNLICMHTLETDASGDFKGFKIQYIIDVDEDGNISINGGTANSSYEAYAKYLAWLAYRLQNDSRCKYFDEISKGYGGSYYGGKYFRDAFKASGIGSLIGWSEIDTSNSSVCDGLEDLDYNASTEYDGYVARFIFFQSLGGGQDQIAVFAKESDNPRINKYIANTSVTGNIASRDLIGENNKMAYPVYVRIGETIEYKIKITAASTAKYTIKDEWDSNLTFVSASISGTQSGNSITWTEVPGGTLITVKLKASSSIGENKESKYSNKASIVGKNKSSSDYVKYLEEKCTIDKYITNVSGSSIGGIIGDRSGLTDNVKMNSAPKVSGSSITVTYAIVIKNTGATAVTGKYEDIYTSGMSYVSGTTSDNITLAMGETKRYDVTLNFSTSTALTYYTNTAKFTYGSNKVTSSDYLQGYTEPEIKGTIKKYITSPSSGDRVSYSEDLKLSSPVEVTKGSTVTYTIWFQNISNYSLKYIDFTDVAGAGLSLTSYSSYDGDDKKLESLGNNRYRFWFCKHTDEIWKDSNNISSSDVQSLIDDGDDLDSNETKILATFTYTVTASDLQLTSIENRVYLNALGYLTEVWNYSTHKADCDCHGYNYSCDTPCSSWDETVGWGVNADGSYYPVKVSHSYCPGHYKAVYCFEDGNSCGAPCCLTCYDRIWRYAIYSEQTFSDSSADYIRLLDPEIGGYVWFDLDGNGYKDGSDGTTVTANNGKIYYASDVKVELRNASNGSVIATTTPNSSGYYSFGRVRKGQDISGSNGSSNGYTSVPTGQSFYYSSSSYMSYYIVFDYFGERLITTTYNAENEWGGSCTNYTNNSDAWENQSERTTFNNSLETIANNRAYAGTTSSSTMKDLVYDKNGHTSKLIWGPESSDKSSRTTTMKAYTGNIYPTTDYNATSKPYLKYLNLGLKLRAEYGDLSLTKDVYKAEVTVNGYQTTYTYDSLGSGNYTVTSDRTVSNPYKLRIYREDYEFRTANYGELASIVNLNNRYMWYGRNETGENGIYGNDLNIIITYKITITNSSNSSDAVIREILDYSSDTMSLQEIRMDSITGENVYYSSGTSFNSGTSYATTGYNLTFINGGTLEGKRLSSGSSMTLYTVYKVNKTSDGYIKKDSISTLGKVNIAEISAYSLYNKGTNTPTGIVDQDSNPGNTTDPSNTSEYEDDTFRTSIQVLLRDEDGRYDMQLTDYRIISGCVWEEINGSSTDTSDGQIVGNGYKDEDDIGAANVLVKLYEVINLDGTEYLVDTGLWCRTDKTGYYGFGGETYYYAGKLKNIGSENKSTDDCYRLHAGKYIVRFIYGDEAEYLVNDSTGTTIKYSGQDYKSVTYTEVGVNSEDQVLKASAFNNYTLEKYQLNKELQIYSFAKDNEARRLEVTAYSTTMTNTMDQILKATSDEQKVILATNTSMYADTKKFDIDIEYYENYSTDISLAKYIDLSVDKNTKNISKYCCVIGLTENIYNYHIANINFGLIQRPITKLELMDDITEIIAKTSDGNVILDINYDVIYTKKADGTISHKTVLNKENSIGIDMIQSLDRTSSNQGFRYVNIDTELLQGLTITIKYRIAIANNSEIDHISTVLDTLVKNSNVELNVDYGEVNSTSSTRSENTIIEKLKVDGTTRTYDYSTSSLYKESQEIKNSSPRGVYKYLGGSTYKDSNNETHTIGSDDTGASYTYRNLFNQNRNYYFGYYMGNIYYNGVKSDNDVKVETRIDQYVDYVDQDLVFKAEDNVDADGNITYLTYSISEIASKGLMNGITSSTTEISDGKIAYCNSTNTVNNNLAFNIEDGTVNSKLYKYLYASSLYDGDIENSLYMIDLEASRTLSSESLNGVIIDNLAEIVKVSNTVGRKAYVIRNSSTGYIGDSAKQIGAYSTKLEAGLLETDTDFTEYVTFSPPTGLSKVELVKLEVENNVVRTVEIVIAILVLVTSGISIIRISRKKKFYK